MNHWAQMLTDLPALGQRTIARSQRVSLPRGADAATRCLRLRYALCHAATVRATYALLLPEAQTALQDLRLRRGGICAAELAERYGPVRSWKGLAADPTPRSLAEQLLLLGWLLPRPARPRHPLRFLLAPELRRWLPEPLPAAAPGAPHPARTLAVRAAQTLLLACAERPRALTLASLLRRGVTRLLAPRLPEAAGEAAALFDWLMPLLLETGLLEAHRGTAQLTLAGQRFLALADGEQFSRLIAAWLHSPTPDAWLHRLCSDLRGIDWPVLRRRLCTWGAVLPADAPADPLARYRRLARSLGPLADAQTHGYRTVDRAPWQPRRAAGIFAAALVGPLGWLGLAGAQVPSDDKQTEPVPDTGAQPDESAGHEPRSEQAEAQPPDRADPRSGSAEASVRWRYGAPGAIVVPHGAPAALGLLPFVRWAGADAAGTTYQVTPSTLARAERQGWSASQLWLLLAAHMGAAPEGWRAGLESNPGVRLVRAEVLLVDTPALLKRAGRVRSVAKHLERVAPGIALVRHEQRAALLRALERQGIACAVEAGGDEQAGELVELQPAPARRCGREERMPELSAGERAALLVACAHYRRHAPADAPLLPHAQLEARLSAGLSPQLAASVETALRLFSPSSVATDSDLSMQPLAQSAILAGLREALERQCPVELSYDTAGQGAPNTRIVRPLTLDERGDTWYLRAYCSARQAERTFRVDRICALRVA